jgi:hypothetical protein
MLNEKQFRIVTARLAGLFCLGFAAVVLASCSETPDANDQTKSTAQTGDVKLTGAIPAELTGAQLPDADAIQSVIDASLDATERRRLNTEDHAAWQIVHGIMAFGAGLHIEHQGEMVPALAWLLKNGELTGWNLRPGDKGLEAIMEPGTQTGQGHEDQWLGYLSLCGLDADDSLTVRGREHKVNELVTQAMWDVRDGMEASWTLMGLSTYLPLDTKWEASNGETWDIERLIALEAEYPLSDSPCGGTHRLIGMTIALNRFLSENEGELNGGWQAAEDKIQSATELAKEYQNADGTFSAEFFGRPSSTADVALKINTTGHTLEFLCYALSREQIRSPEYDWVARAAVRLAELLDDTQELPLECGSLYHAAHGLQLYRLQRLGPRVFDSQPEETVAAGPAVTTTDLPSSTPLASQPLTSE